MKTRDCSTFGIFLTTTLLCLPLAALAQSADSAGGESRVEISAPHKYASVFLDSDSYAGSLTLNIDPADVGETAALYAAGSYNGQWYIGTAQGWQPWDASLDSLTPFDTRILTNQTTISFFEDATLPAGDYRLYAAYQVAGEDLVVASTVTEFEVHQASRDRLYRFQSDQAMADYIKGSMDYSASDTVYRTLETVSTDDSSSSGGPLVSGTNLQETGVDEADAIKSDGETLFVLRNCGTVNCVASFALEPGLAQAEEVGLYTPESDGSNQLAPAQSLYLVEGENGDATLVTLSGQSYAIAWFDVWGWRGNEVRLEFLDASDPARLSLSRSLTLDGNLISSRRIGNTLYVVTRYTPFIEGFVPLAYDDASQTANATLLSETTLSDLLPAATLDDAPPRDLVTSTNCYLATGSVDLDRNPSMITVTTIPLDQPDAFTSTCFMGNTETVYMTTNALYLATTQYEYSVPTLDALIYNPDHRTAIHKFALTDGAVAYRGSGEVQGHLGWSEDKRSFRMGANGDNDAYLNVVTSIGDSWGPSSSTRLTVLQEADGELKTVDFIDGIGKPGEQLYAARFLGDRAYLVTFRIIDPLYVIDLSDQENPVIAGELEIEGYSDYLHPVGESLLLGIGKDAIPDDGSSDFGAARGAWYQGVKVSLFDVADPSTPLEIDSLVFGKRGSESEVLQDHHAFSFLPATATRPARFALPIQVNETVPDNSFFDPEDPSAWYNFTSKGLYQFEADQSGLNLAGVLDANATNNGTPFNFFGFFGDRSLLVDDAVFYVHQGEVISGFWGAP